MRAWRLGLMIVLLAGAGPAAAQTALIDRGRQLVEGIAACGNCHTPKGPDGEVPGMTLAGGFVIDIPNAFRAVTPNITQDAETGIGRWSDAEIGRAVREGKRPDGSTIGPPMPFELYRNSCIDRERQKNP
jgi:mono/diheme cytochrome c family protein